MLYPTKTPIIVADVTDMAQTCNEAIIEATAKKLQCTKSLVRSIAEAQSKFTVEVVEKGLFDGVRWLHLWKIIPKADKLYHVNRRKGL